MEMTVGRILVLVLLTRQVLGFPPQGRLMPDGAPVPEDVVAHEDSMASASETGEEYEDVDDSDMYMEPEDDGDEDPEVQEEEPSPEALRKNISEGHPRSSPQEAPPKSSRIITTTPKPHIQQQPELKPQRDHQEAETARQAGGQKASGKEEEEDGSLETDSQNFFPSFAELFANPRPPFTEQRYRPNRFLGYFQRDRSGFQTAAASSAKDTSHPLLGSGNFGVIRGGTYYPEDKEADDYPAAEDSSVYSPYYHGAGRGRASYFRNPKPQPIRGGDFFANFRDFADITAPPKSSFSHLSVVYANKNGSATASRITEPRNIIETLRMLEEEEEEQQQPEGSEAATTVPQVARKKQSKGKRKLMKMRQFEEEKARRSRISVEPLLALS